MLSSLTKIATLLPVYPRAQTREFGLNTTFPAISQAARGPRFAQVKDTISLTEHGRLAARIDATARTASNLGDFATGFQVAEKALSDIAAKLAAIKVLVAQAASPERSFIERARLNAQFEALRNDIDQLADQAIFNGLGLLDGDGSQSDLNLTQAFGVADLGASIDSDDGIESYFIATQPNGLSDGDTLQVEYSATTGLFTVTNTTTGEVATAEGPSSSPDEGEYAYVNVADFGLTIELNSSFDHTTDNSVDAGDQAASELTVQVLTTETLTTQVSDTLTLSASLGTSDTTRNDLSVSLLPATVADLAPGLVFDDIATRRAAGAALANVMAAETQLDTVRAQLAADMERLGVAGQRLTADGGIHERDRAEVLSRRDSVALVSAINARVLGEAAPLLSAHALTASRDFLTMLASRIEPLAQKPAERADPAAEETEAPRSSEAEPRPRKREAGGSDKGATRTAKPAPSSSGDSS
jgi:flagellin-like hook-associated protein FlgL